MVELAGVMLAVVLVAGFLALRGLLLRLLGRGPTSPYATRQARRLRGSRALAQVQAERLEALTQELARTRARLRLAERERELLRIRRDAVDDRFPRAKRAFAMRFHPDRVTARGLEGSLRRALFQEYWALLQRIERG